MHLKSVTAPPQPEIGLSSVYEQLPMNWDIPLPDGSPLTDCYSWEETRLNAMRVGEANPLAYVWVPARSISLSRREAARLDLARSNDEPLAIRGTGGTAVPQGPGTANITLFTRHDRAPGITEFYQQMCGALMSGFEAMGLKTTIGAKPGSFCDGDFNLLYNGQKLAGTAQRWCRARNGQTLGCHHVVVLTGGNPAELCHRIEALYAASGAAETFASDAHSDLAIQISDLRTAMREPLRHLVKT
jgi:lipoate-protein ligase A